jgi:NAD(P)H dehydrogenase (quinone)
MTKVAVVYHSGYGHTEVLARSAAQGVTDGGSDAVLVKIDGAVQDFGPVLDQLADADAIIFGSPTYMGDVSAAFKGFAEASSKVLATGGWKDKLAAAFTVSHSFAGDKHRTIDSIQTLASQHGMVWVSLGLAPPNVTAAERGPDTINRVAGFAGAMAQADNGPADETITAGDRETLRLLGERVALAAARWARGADAFEVRAAA